MDDMLQAWTWLPFWPYALLIITVVCWALYRLLAPKSWFEWAGAGVLQAFIIALYAEMYGFPLTVYFISASLPLDIPLSPSTGHLWATLLGAGEVGAVVETIVGYSFFLAGMLLIVKGWVWIYFSGTSLVTTNVYSIVRHPQYVGIFLIVFGEMINWPTLPGLILSPVIFFLYIRLAILEEKRLLKTYSKEYASYMEVTPRFIPSWRRQFGIRGN